MATSLRSRVDLEKGWKDPKTLKAFDSFRRPFRGATSKIVRSVLSRYINGKDKIIEIGSGLGEFLTLVPEYAPQTLQTEQAEEVSIKNREKTSSKVITANVYDLPFKDGSFNVVVGYSVFDTLYDLRRALSEVRRILTNDGKFIHFLDLKGSANVPLIRLRQDHKIGFPAANKDGGIDGLRVVPESEAKKIPSLVDPQLRKLLELYLDNPEKVFGIIERERIGKFVSEEIEKHAPNSPVLNFNEYFIKEITTALESSGFNVLESKKIRGEDRIKDPNLKSFLRPDSNMIFMDTGMRNEGHDSAASEIPLQEGELKVVSILHVIVAQPKSDNQPSSDK